VVIPYWRATRDTDTPGWQVSSTMRRLASSLNRRRLPGSVTTVGAGFSILGLSVFGLSILGLSELGLELGPELGLSRGYRPHRAFGPTASSRFS
jgi:hypothetical protein